MKIAAILIPCSKSKMHPTAPTACAATLLRTDQWSVERAWLDRLRELPVQCRAGELYAGRGFKHGKRAAELAQANLYIVSAGLGIIPADQQVPSYGITISGSGEESARSRVSGRFDIAHWWKAIARGPYAIPLSEVMEQTEGEVLLGLSRPYLQMIAEELKTLTAKHLEKLRIVGASIDGILPERFARCVITLDQTEIDRDVSGTRYDGAQRALLHFVHKQMPASAIPAPSAINNRFAFLLDSGAFTVWRKGKAIKVEDYAAFVHKHKRLFRAGIFNLDVIGSDKGSYENWLELRRLGVETIPVHHFGDDDLYLKRYLDQVDYIALGGMAKLHAKARISGLDYLWGNFLLDGKEARCQVHGLGITDDSIMLRFPWYSFDSARAGITANSGSIVMPRQRGGSPDYSDLYTLYLSQRRGHGVGDASSFYALSPRIRQEVLNFTRSEGFDISEDWSEENGVAAQNLTDAWQQRYAWNLLILSRFVQHYRERGMQLRVYDSLNSTGLLEITAQNERSGISRCLVSYANLVSGRTLLDLIGACRG